MDERMQRRDGLVQALIDPTASVRLRAHATAGRDAPPDDPTLVAAARDGDRAAFEQLVLRYQDRVFRLLYRKLGNHDEALEASQEVFLRAWRAIGRFQGHAQFYTWLFRIALNCAFSTRKRRHRRNAVFVPAPAPEHERDGEPEPPARTPGPEAEALRREQGARIHAAIAALPPLYQQIVLLRDIEGMRYEEIGQILDLPLGSVKSRLHRARLQLRTVLADLWSETEGDGR